VRLWVLLEKSRRSGIDEGGVEQEVKVGGLKEAVDGNELVERRRGR